MKATLTEVVEGVAVRRAFFTVCLGLATTGWATAQQPLVARAAKPATHLAAQVDPGPGGQLAPESPQATSGTVKDDLFAGTEKFAKGASEVSEISMDPDTLNMVSGNGAKKAHNMILSTVRSYSYDKPGMYNPADVEEYRRKIMTADWHCSVHTREKNGESTDICSRRPSPDTIENVIITVEPKELTFIHSIKRINGQGSGVDVGGMGDMFFGMPPQVTMAMARPEMMAEMAAAQAEMKANSAALREQLGDLHQFKFDMPQIDADQFKISIPPIDQEELQTQMRHMQESLKNFHIEVNPDVRVTPGVPAVPEVPEAPDAPEAAPTPAVPSAPQAPAAPQAPSAPQPPPAPPAPAAL